MPVNVKIDGAANSVVHKGANYVSVTTVSDVCKTPSAGGPIPIPHPNISQPTTLAKGTTPVKAYGGMMIAINESEFSYSMARMPGLRKCQVQHVHDGVDVNPLFLRCQDRRK